MVDGFVHDFPHGGTILRVNELKESGFGVVEPAWLQAEDLLELSAPPDSIGRQICDHAPIDPPRIASESTSRLHEGQRRDDATPLRAALDR